MMCNKNERASISIFAILILPCVLLGFIFLYEMLLEEYDMNHRLKTVMMHSDVQLSKHSRYMFNNYGLMVYLDEGELEKNLEEKLKNDEITIETFSLNNLNILLQSISNSEYALLTEMGRQKLDEWKTNGNEPKDEKTKDSQLDTAGEGSPELIKTLYELNKRLSALKKNQNELEMGTINKVDNPWGETPHNLSLSIKDFFLIREYALQVFKSYDLKCPRLVGHFKSHTSRKSSLQGEVEYLIFGEDKDQDNVWRTRLALLALRETANLAALVQDQVKMTAIANATSALPAPWNLVATGLIISIWSGAESYIDVQRLFAGEGFNPVKSTKDWIISLESLMEGDWSGETPNNNKSSVLDSDWYYADYLRLMLTTCDNEVLMKRILYVLESNLDLQTNGAYKMKQFSIGHKIEVIANNKRSFHFLNGYYHEK